MHGDDRAQHADARGDLARPARAGPAPACGSGSGVGFTHLDTFEIGEGVFIGAQSYLQGRFDGTCVIGDHVWIGPQSYFDARNLVIEEYVGWGPGAQGARIDAHRRARSTCRSSRPISRSSRSGSKRGPTSAPAPIVLPGVTVGRGSSSAPARS